MAAGASLLALIDDVASMLKVTAQKTVGVLGDDLALGSQKAMSSNISMAHRELPVVWAIFKGSLINKIILVPLALLVAYFAPPLITVALIVGGLYLSFEGFEKVYEHFQKDKLTEPIESDLPESEKIKGAIRTDMILSLEVIVLTLGIVAASTFLTKVTVLAITAFAMSIIVYSLIAGIIRMDDLGLKLISNSKENTFKRKTGVSLVQGAPHVMKWIGIIGTIAMFSVGGGIILHVLHIDFNTLKTFFDISFGSLENGFINGIFELLMQLNTGIVLGGIVFLLIESIYHIKNKIKGE